VTSPWPGASAPIAAPPIGSSGAAMPAAAGGTRPLTIAPTTLGGGATEVGRNAARGGPGKLVLIGASLAGLAAALAFVVMRGRDAGFASSPGAEARPSTPATAAQARPAHVEAPPAPAPVPAPAPTSSSITLTGLPDGATVRLDGRPARSPLIVPRGPGSHRLAVEAEGYQPWEQSIDGSSDQTLAVRLKQKAAEAAAPAKAKRRNEPHRNPGHFNGFSDLY
jgi:hypothetical protein